MLPWYYPDQAHQIVAVLTNPVLLNGGYAAFGEMMWECASSYDASSLSIGIMNMDIIFTRATQVIGWQIKCHIYLWAGKAQKINVVLYYVTHGTFVDGAKETTLQYISINVSFYVSKWVLNRSNLYRIDQGQYKKKSFQMALTLTINSIPVMMTLPTTTLACVR